jgi:hypothetical protein
MPRKHTNNSTTKLAATHQPLNDLHRNVDSETRRDFVGPMPVEDFFNEFLPVELSSAD